MNKICYFILFLLIVGVGVSGCKAAEQSLTMTASEVCQYVNQALKNEYQYLGLSQRYELSYKAQSAIYEEEVTDEPKTASIIQNLTPGALKIFREELNTMSPKQKVVAAYNLRGIKEVEDIVQEVGVTWLVEVEITYELQRLDEGQWFFKGVSTDIEQYLFNEKTSILTKR